MCVWPRGLCKVVRSASTVQYSVVLCCGQRGAVRQRRGRVHPTTARSLARARANCHSTLSLL